MRPLAPFVWILGSVGFFVVAIWIAVRMIRWAKRQSTSTNLLGLAMQLPSAGINPMPTPQQIVEEVTDEIQRKNKVEDSGPDK